MKFILYVFMLTVAAVLQMLFARGMTIPRASGEYLFLFAFCISLFAPRKNIIPLFFIAGIFRDIFLTQQLGPATILYTLCGIMVTFLRNYISSDHVFTRYVFFLLGLFSVLFILGIFSSGHYSSDLLEAAFYNSVYTLLLAPLFRIFVMATSFADWDKRTGVLL